MSTDAIYVNLEFTPNPNTLKFSVNRNLLPSGAANFTDASQCEEAPLAKQVFEVPGIEAVMVGTNFVTITKSPTGSWDSIAENVPQRMQSFLEQESAAFTPKWFEQEQLRRENQGSGDDVEDRIREILDLEIRPAVAMDGGDIVFDRYEDGVVYLYLQGACSSCPSSAMTLKMGVETRLKDAIPEVKEVVQV
ncbi:MAG: NifU family protein [Bdellovibrionales bacterium]|nr:NifU family protein [Bdellovibrionales bacterium]